MSFQSDDFLEVSSTLYSKALSSPLLEATSCDPSLRPSVEGIVESMKRFLVGGGTESEWEIRGWLEEIGYEQFGDRFVEEECDELEILYSLDEADLKEIGIPTLGARRKIKIQIGKLKEALANPPSPPSPPPKAPPEILRNNIFQSGDRVKIKELPVNEAEKMQEDHGGWAPSMEPMLGGTGSVSRTFQNGSLVRVNVGGSEFVWNHQLLIFVSPSTRIPVGSTVALVRGYEGFEDAASGPLKLGDEGTLEADDKTSKPYRVKAKGGRSWWYCEDAICLASEAKKMVCFMLCSVVFYYVEFFLQ